MSSNSNQHPVIEAKDIKKHFNRSGGLIDRFINGKQKPIKAVDGVSISIGKGDSIGIIGESGCGKTTLLHTLLGLEEPSDGKIYYQDNNIGDFDRDDWKDFRSNVQVVFQDPFNSLDPKMTVRESLLEPLKIHNLDNRNQRIDEVLEMVELQPSSNYLDSYPAQLSGGEKQRVSIARALTVEPDVLVADEPVSMLDVSTQAALLNLLSELVKTMGISLVYVTHDLSTTIYVCDQINIMYLGRVVESGETEHVMNNPKHPYSKALIEAVPVPNPHNNRERVDIKGKIGDPIDVDSGCRFKDRCPERMDVCDQTPISVQTGENHHVACHLYYNHSEFEANGEVSERIDTIHETSGEVSIQEES